MFVLFCGLLQAVVIQIIAKLHQLNNQPIILKHRLIRELPNPHNKGTPAPILHPQVLLIIPNQPPQPPKQILLLIIIQLLLARLLEQLHLVCVSFLFEADGEQRVLLHVVLDKALEQGVLGRLLFDEVGDVQGGDQEAELGGRGLGDLFEKGFCAVD